MSSRLAATCRTIFVFTALLLDCPFARAEIVTLRNGQKLEGRLGRIHSLAEDPYNPSGGGGEIKVKQIVFLDDDLRRTYFSSKQIQPPLAESGLVGERIAIKQRVAQSGPRIGGVGPILRIGPWNKLGQRVITLSSARGPMDVIQGITEVTPTYTKVEGLLGKYGVQWDMRLATSSIPREILSEILQNQLDPQDPDARLRIVRLYIQSQRYKDARLELEAIIEQFPELADLQKQVVQLRQMRAQRMIQEIEFRRDAGQHRLAYSMASSFPEENVAAETRIAVRDIVAQYDRDKQLAGQLLQSLQAHLQQIEDANTRQRVAPMHQEIAAELNIHTLNRLADYQRLADDPELAPDQKVALAISGWLLGSGSGTDNLAVATSLWDVRDLVARYLRSEQRVERGRILDQLLGLEASDPAHVAKILAQMKPPLVTEIPGAAQPVPPAEPDATAAPPPPAEPQAAAAADEVVPGLLDLTTQGLEIEPEVHYLVQLPPEYDPYRRYPCIVTLNGAGTTPADQIDWWAGQHSKADQMRLGQASRRGYIVIAPRWSTSHQRSYEYTAREHAAVMFSLRDACKRFAIDTDRVFLSGHSMGGDAAWDIGISHPDTWAGIVPIVATADKYIPRYWENARQLPMYFVCGQLDGSRMSINGPEWDRYLTKHTYDCTVVEYLGRGHEHFHDEIQRIFDWMSHYQRSFFPREFSCYSMRSWDNFFWWVELDSLPPRSMVPPVHWPPPGSVRPIPTEGRVLENNRISVRTGADKTTVWLAPEIVDFSQRIAVTVNGRNRAGDITPSTATMLEDVRTRGDRQHPFWAKVEAP